MGAGSWLGAGAFAVLTALAFLLNRDRPGAVWARLAMLSFVELTICGLGLAMIRRAPGLAHFGLLFMADGMTFLAAAEALRFWFYRLERRAATDGTGLVVDTRWAVAILRAIPGSLLVLTFIADWLGLVTIEHTWLAGLIFLARNDAALVGDATDRVAAACLPRAGPACGRHARPGVMRRRLGQPGVLAGWLAVAAAVLGLALWGVGVGSRRFKLSAFYTEPCFHTAFALTVGAFVAAPGCAVPGPRKPTCWPRRRSV